MPTPRPDTYTAASGAAVYGGRTAGAPAPAPPPAPSGTPAWLSAMTVGQWGQIAGTAGPGAGLNTNAFCDITLRPSDSSLLVVAAGGHSDGASNAAASIKLSDDAPAWVTRRASSWNGTEINVNYYADGTPTSRHTYHHTHYIASIDAVLLAGCRYGYGNTTPTHGGMDLFSLSTNQYLTRYTWPDITPWAGAGFGVVLDGAGNLWTEAGYKFNVSTLGWSKPGTGNLLRHPAAYDSVRDRIFALQFNDGEGYGSAGLSAVELDPNTGNSRAISFNASAALTQFTADAPQYAGMAYCPADGKFYFLHPGRMGTFYVVTPSGSATWDMATYTPAGTAPTSSGVLCKRLLWVPAYSGFVVQGNQASNLHFLRTA